MTIILSDDVGINIKNIRKCRCLTQRELAKLSGINEATIQKYECGTRKPKDENLRKIACALQMDFMIFRGYKAEKISKIELECDLDYLL
jgi:transcriptional regulator with XRE-family HTH domain